MSSIIGKKFKNIGSGEIIKIMSLDSNIAVLENDQRISIERLLDVNHYIEYGNSINETMSSNIHTDTDIQNNDNNIMENNNLYNQLFTQIKSLSNDDVNRASGVNDTQVERNQNFINPVESHSDAQRAMSGDVVDKSNDSQHKEMLERAKREQLELDAKIKRQANRMNKMIDGVEDDIDESDRRQVNRNLEGATVEGERRETNVNITESVGNIHDNVHDNVRVNRPNVPPAPEINPMFLKMKRTNKVSLKIDIDEMIPNKDLLKMLEEGFEDSVLEYLTQEIANKVLSDVNIKSQIHKKLHEYVYGKTRAPRKKTTTKATTKATTKTTTKATTKKQPIVKKVTPTETNDVNKTNEK